MSIRSQMQDKTAAMIESMAERARTPQEIESIRQRIIAGVQTGALKPYIGVPLVEDLTRRLTTAQQSMAQTAMGVPPAQGGAPIAQQIMAQAQQPGIEALPSDLPQSYAPGGLVAFADGGEVERYQNEGLVRSVPGVPSYMQWMYSGETQTERRRRERLEAEARARAAKNPQFGESLPAPPAAPAAATPFTLDPARMTAEELGPVPGSSDTDIFGGRVDQRGVASLLDATSPHAPAAAVPFYTAPKITAPTVKQTTLAPMNEPDLTNLKDLVEGAPIEAKNAFDAAIEREQEVLSAMNAPIEQAREAKFAARQAQNEKNAAITTALGIISTGLGVAGSKERTLAGALGNEGRQGIEMLVRGEAANRAAMEKLDDARDNFEQQKLATRKGDRAAAMAAGQRASDDVYKYQTMNLTAAQAGNSQALQRLAIDEARAGTQAQLTQGVNLAQSQLDQGAGIANAQLAQGAAGLGLQAQHLKQTAEYQNQQIQMLQKRFEASNAATKAKMAQIQSVAFNKFVTTVEPQLNQELAKQYGPNWRTGTDVRSIQAQQVYNLRKQQYMIDALGQSEEQRAFSGARSAEDLLGDS